MLEFLDASDSKNTDRMEFDPDDEKDQWMAE